VPDASGGARRPSYAELASLVAAQRELIEQLQARVAEQEALIDELRRQANRNSGNSSMSPSQDPPLSRAERRQRAREAYKRSMRQTGGQPGHQGKTRELVAAGRVDQRFEHLPERCGCGHLFCGGEERIGDPVIHQQYELPPARPLVFEHARVRLQCPACGRPMLAELPGPALSGYGPRLEAHIALLGGVFRLSRDQVRQVVSEVFGIPSCKGTIDHTLARINAILADPWAELREAIREAQAVHLDETTWRLRGAQQWLWVAASALAACYRIDPHRSQQAAKALIGEDFGGFAVTDRYVGYHFLDVLQQQLCWAHVIRQLTEISERKGITGRRGEKLVELARGVIAAHRQYLEHAHEPEWLAKQLAPLREQIRALLQQCANGRHERTASFASGLLDEYDALWTFADVPQAGIEPTNNTAERAMRHPVLMRKLQGGTQSDRGNRWIERIQSVRETCRLQDRRVLDWLTDAVTAAHHGQPIPSLAPT
jgi:transposase